MYKSQNLICNRMISNFKKKQNFLNCDICDFLLQKITEILKIFPKQLKWKNEKWNIISYIWNIGLKTYTIYLNTFFYVQIAKFATKWFLAPKKHKNSQNISKTKATTIYPPHTILSKHSQRHCQTKINPPLFSLSPHPLIDLHTTHNKLKNGKLFLIYEI